MGAITHIATTTTGPNLGGIGAITVAVVNGVPKLFVGSEATSGMSVFTLSQTGATYQEQLGYAANRGTAGVCDLDFVTIGGQSVLIPSGRFDDRLSLHKIDVDGGFNGLSILGADPALIGQLNHSVALQLPAGYVAFNTDVTAGPGGFSYMAIELNAPKAIVGNPFTSVFARTQSEDLSRGWELLDPTTHVYTKARYSACPTLRYFEEDQFFYMTTLFGEIRN